EEKLFRAAASFQEMLEGIHGKRRTLPIQLDAAGEKAGIRRRCQAYHQIAMFRLGKHLPLLVGRSRGGNEDYPVQTELASDVLGNQQVAVVDRIERPTHQADASHRSAVSSPLRSLLELPPGPPGSPSRPHPC